MKMQEQPLTAQEIEKEFSDITEMVEQEKVKLTPDVSEYLHDWMEIILRKVEKGMDITRVDLHFLNYVKFWMGMPEDWRNDNPDISDLIEAEKELVSEKEYKLIKKESIKRGITTSQMFDLICLIGIPLKGFIREDYFKWIDENFGFENGKIISKGDLEFIYNTSIVHLPEGLIINGDLTITATMIHELPEGIVIKGNFDASWNSYFSSFPKNFKIGGDINLIRSGVKEIPDGLTVNGDFSLSKTEISTLAKELNVKGTLSLLDTNVKHLPDDIQVEGDVLIYAGNKSLIEDAEKLRKRGQIKGEIKIIDK